MAKPQIPFQATERDMLVAFLDFQRAVVLDKAGDLSQEELGITLPPSTMSLAGIVYHLAVVEESWFDWNFLGNPMTEPWASVDWEADRDWEWHTAPTMDPEEVLDAYRRASARSNAIVAAADSLDELAAKKSRSERSISLRWILVHMIEETARHAGHADLIRESIDGATGDFRDDT